MFVLVNLLFFSITQKVKKYEGNNFRKFIGGFDGEGKERGQYFKENRGLRVDIFSK